MAKKRPDMAKPDETTLAKQIVGNAGLFYVCYKLSLLGWNAMPTSRNARGIDVVCFSMDGTKRKLIQVKTLTKSSCGIKLGSDRKVMGDFWIIVTNLRDQPKCHILTPRDVSDGAVLYPKDGEVYWLPSRNWLRDDFLEKWDQIEYGD